MRVFAAGTGHPHVDVSVPYQLARALAGLLERLVPRGVPELDALVDAVGDAVDAGLRGPVVETTDGRGDRIEIVVD